MFANLLHCFDLFFRGAVAQLGERCVRNAEAEGSTPFRSTILTFLGPVCRIRRWSVKHVRRITTFPAMAFEVHPNPVLQLFGFLLRSVLVATDKKRNGVGS